jgi:uncharacterized protein YbaR (Trm112 family)
MGGSGQEAKVEPWLRAQLLCPACRGELDDVADGLACGACGLTYPVVDGVPWLTAEQAKLSSDARQGGRRAGR